MRDEEEISDRVRRIILAHQLRDSEFAAMVSLDAPKLSKSLGGTRRFTSLELARIADRFDVTVDYLLGVESSAAALAARVSEPTVLKSVDVAQSAASRYAQRREDLCSLGYGLGEGPRPPALHGLMIKQGAQLATWAIGQTKECQRSVTDRDLADTIETVFNIDVAVETLPERFDGIAWRDNECRLILVGASSIPGRQRFTLAHELCHILTEDDQQLLVVEEDVYRKTSRTNLSEMRANAFAAAYLMPESEIRSRLPENFGREAFAELSCSLSVTPSTLSYRLMNLDLIDEDAMRQLKVMTTEEAARIAGRSAALGDWVEFSRSARLPRRLVQDSFRAYLDGQTTLRPYASLIGADVDDLRQALDSESSELTASQ